MDMKNYRFISLTNVDYKIFSSVIAERLKKVAIEIIHEDQKGFVPNRQSKTNIRTVVNILEHFEYHIEKKWACILLDVEKAFDRVNWNFMIEMINIM